MSNTQQITAIKQLRKIASEFNSGQISQCIDEQVSAQVNHCGLTGENNKVLNALSRAGVIRQLVEDGSSLPEAARELGRRMRYMTDMTTAQQ